MSGRNLLESNRAVFASLFVAGLSAGVLAIDAPSRLGISRTGKVTANGAFVQPVSLQSTLANAPQHQPVSSRVAQSNSRVQSTLSADNARVARAWGRRPLSFESNKGQVDERVKFISRGRGYTLFLTPREAVLSLRKSDTLAGDALSPTQRAKVETAMHGPRAQTSAPSVLRLSLAGANATPKLSGQGKMAGISNYLIGNSKNWKTRVPHFAKVLYDKGIWYELDVWGQDMRHDWPTWRNMLPHYLATRF